MAYDLPSARGRVNEYARTKTQAGRDLTDEEFTQLGQQVGYGGGDVSDDMLNSAYGTLDSHFGALPPSPQTGGPDPRQPESGAFQPAPESIEGIYDGGGYGNDQVNFEVPDAGSYGPDVFQGQVPPDVAGGGDMWGQAVPGGNKALPLENVQMQTGGPGGAAPFQYTGPRGPGNPTDEEIEDFLRRNPGDEHRIAEGFSNIPGQDRYIPGGNGTGTNIPPGAVPPGGGGGQNRTPTDSFLPPRADPDLPPPHIRQPAPLPGGGEDMAIPPNLRDQVPGLFTPREPSALELQTQQALQDLITRMGAPVSLDDPTLSPIAAQAATRTNRNIEDRRAAAASRAQAMGLGDSGAADVEAQQIQNEELAGQRGLETGLLRDEQLQRRSQLMAGLELANQMGQFDKAQQLQTQLALLDASLAKSGLELQGELGRGRLGLDTELGRGGLDLERELGRGRLGLDTQLGLGRLGLDTELGRGRLGLDTQLGLGGLALDRERLGLDRQLGMGRLGLDTELGRRAQDLQRMGIDVQRLLGQGDLDIRGRSLTQQGQLGRGALGVDLLRALMQNDQTFAQLGLSAAQIQALLNQDAMRTLLGAF